MPSQTNSTSDKQALLDQLLEQHEAEQYELPALQSDFSKFEQFTDQLKELFNSFFDSLNVPVPPSAPELFGKVLVVSLYLTLGAVLLGTLVWLVLRLRDLRNLDSADLRHATLTGKRYPLEHELQQAREEGQWARALRLRWKLFLYEASEASYRTPGELIRSNSSEATSGPLLLSEEQLLHLYTQMFAKEGSNPTAYEKYETLLKGWEDSIKQMNTAEEIV